MKSSLSGLLNNAKRAAQRRGQSLSTAHILLAMFQSNSQMGVLLAQHGVREVDLINSLHHVGEEPASAIEIAIERAEKIAKEFGESSPRAIHLLVAIVREVRSSGFRCLERNGVSADMVCRGALSILKTDQANLKQVGYDRQSAKQQFLMQLSQPSQPPIRSNRWVKPKDDQLGKAKGLSAQPLITKRARRILHDDEKKPRLNSKKVTQTEVSDRSSQENLYALDQKRFPVLNTIGRNLMVAAVSGEIDPIFGREREIEQLLDILGRRRANNPILVGPPGVGKTAIIEGLALRLVGPELVRKELTVLRIIEVSVGTLVSGTGVRGALAEKIRAIQAEVATADLRVVLFIDEIHNLVGGQDGPDSVANELKAALARGKLPCIGATTEGEYRRLFERDTALSRRFTRIDISEPDPQSTLEILGAICPQYERHHGVAFEDEALKAAVDMSMRYLSDRYMPDKAIGLLDQAAARVRRLGKNIVDSYAIAHVISEHTGVPVERLTMRDSDRLLMLETILEERVVGQKEVVIRIAQALRKSAVGFRTERPLGTFLFVGPTGVGKTEMAKAISDTLFPTHRMTRFDMSEFSEPHAVARFLGAPPGYIGHEEGGQLTEAVRRRPYQLILLDEIDKAHPDVLLSLLPLLDDGRLTDTQGRTADFTNTVVIMTSNLGCSHKTNGTRIGFGADSDSTRRNTIYKQALARARRILPAEMWNRIDEPLYFHPLGEKDIETIAHRLLNQAAHIVNEQYNITVNFHPSVTTTLLAAGGYDPLLGARPMKRTVGSLVEAPLAKAILQEELCTGDVAEVYGEGLQIVIQRTQSKVREATG